VKPSSSVPSTLRFGVFELDPRAGELRKKGMKIRLQGQPVEILLMLLEQPGETVTRGELQKKLWPADTFVDFEQGLNNAMNRLRAALDDNAETPRFIETLPRRGYRFVGPLQGRRTFRPKAMDSLVVLPFVNESGDPDADYLGQGIAESIINALSQIRKLRVVPCATTFHFRGPEANPQAVANALNVRAVLTGRVLQRGESLIISAELIDTATESQLWGARYGRKMADIFDVQEEIANEISGRLRLHLTREDKEQITKRPTQSPEAYQFYLRGCFHLRKWTPEGVRRCLEYCRQALEIDPAYALVQALMSRVYLVMGVFGFTRPRDAFARAKSAALKALEIDRALAEAHAALGCVLLYFEWDWPGAEEQFRQALEISPNSSQLHIELANWFGDMGRFDEMVAEAQIAVQLDPLSANAILTLGAGFYECRRDAEAAEQLQKALEVNPDFFWAAYFLAFLYSAQGRHEQAVSLLASAPDIPITRAYMALSFARGGHRETALEIAHELERQPRRDFVGYVLSAVHGLLGEEDEALTILEELFEERLGAIVFLNHGKHEPLRGSPRFQDLLRRIGLPQVANTG
jgi:TolB-like protein/DNA-binding winged helix-turn-helix (wHTH) protein/tetratricopeptide (TPR) repeat protein